MKLSTKARYGLRAMVDLALHYGKKPVLLKDIAKRQEVSMKYLDHIISTLKVSGLVQTARISHGGYVLSRPPSEIEAYEVIRAVEGSLALVECVDDPKICHRSSFCVTMEMLNAKNVEFLCAPVDNIPLPDKSVDIVTTNGIYNLSPDKGAIIGEVVRVLRGGGRTILAEIVLKAPLPDEIRKNINDWFRCIGGALPLNDFLKALEDGGLRDPKVLWVGRNARTGHELSSCAVIRAEKDPNYPSLLKFLYKLFKPFLKSPEKGAETSIYLASSPEVEGVTGKYSVDKKESKSSKESYDESISKRLWEVSAKLTKIYESGIERDADS